MATRRNPASLAFSSVLINATVGDAANLLI